MFFIFRYFSEYLRLPRGTTLCGANARRFTLHPLPYWVGPECGISCGNVNRRLAFTGEPSRFALALSDQPRGVSARRRRAPLHRSAFRELHDRLAVLHHRWVPTYKFLPAQFTEHTNETKTIETMYDYSNSLGIKRNSLWTRPMCQIYKHANHNNLIFKQFTRNNIDKSM